MGKVIAFEITKGGVGKTTTTLNVGYELAHRGFRVLMIDLDAQANLSSRALRPDQLSAQQAYSQDILLNMATGIREFKFGIPMVRDNLAIIPSSISMAGIETRMAAVRSEKRTALLSQLTEALRTSYDYILLDCPPGAGIITVNIIRAADGIFAPVILEDDSIRGLISLRKIIKAIYPNGEKDVTGVILNKYDIRTRLALSVDSNFRKLFGQYLLNSHIRKNVAIGMAARAFMSVREYDSNSHAAEDFSNLVDEIIQIVQIEQ